MPKPKVLILGHSFVRRFAAFIAQSVDKRVKNNLDLSESAQIALQGVGGRTVDKINVFDLQRVRKVQPDIVILEIGSNDLCPRDAKPEIVGSKIETLVQHLHAHFNVRFIVVCRTVARAACPRDNPSYNDRVALLNQYLDVVLEAIPFAEFWRHKGLRKPNVSVLSKDGVHLNNRGQYALYRSYRGAILYALKQHAAINGAAGQTGTPPA